MAGDVSVGADNQTDEAIYVELWVNLTSPQFHGALLVPAGGTVTLGDFVARDSEDYVITVRAGDLQRKWPGQQLGSSYMGLGVVIYDDHLVLTKLVT